MKKRLLRFTYVPGTIMNDHITGFNKLANDLHNMDVTFSDEDMALMLLSSLFDEYEHLETALLHGNDEVSLKEVCLALYNYEQRKREKQKSGEGEALVVRGRSQNHMRMKKRRSKSRSKPSKDECAFCRENGHWEKDCPKLKNKAKPNNGKVVHVIISLNSLHYH